MSADRPPQERELRLALICYGGISLAVYMHGLVKEIWHIARASRAAQDGAEPLTGSAGVYQEMLADLAARTGIRLRVLVDIVAGASAGGINGVFLAQAIATGQSLDPLTALWLDKADIEALIDPVQAPASALSRPWARPIAWMALGREGEEVSSVDRAARDELRAKLDHFFRARWFEPPFGGRVMVDMLLDAFAAMAAAPAGPRLLPDGQPLDLFVTVTDFTGHPELLRLNSPAEVVETEHRLVIGFSDHAGGTLADAAELVFAARATSSFPGAFPPFRVGELDAALTERDMAWDGREAFLRRVLPRQSAVGMAEAATLIDGSVLANAPFQPAIDALRNRPAKRQIDRRFVYLDPAPGHKFGLAPASEGPPGFLQTILGALSELPRKQPIRDNLDAIQRRSEQIERMLAIVEQVRGPVEEQVEALFGYTLFLDWPTPARLAGWRAKAQVRAAQQAGIGHAAYGLLKIGQLLDRLAAQAGAIAGDASPEWVRRTRVRFAGAVRAAGADCFGPEGASDATIDFLRSHDLPFRIRRLRLLVRTLTTMEGAHGSAPLAAVREAVFASLAPYLACERADRFAGLKSLAGDARADPAEVLAAMGDAMDLPTLDADTDARLSAALSAMPREIRRPLLLAYLGFPFFDVATLPLLGGEGLDEFDPVRVDRIAPDDAPSIRGGGAEATLKGIRFHNFGAFFSRSYRENDYLWGRLHGAERMIDIALSTLPADVHLPPGYVATLKRRAFVAILDEEEPRLAAIGDLFAELRAEIG
ncbi:patatin [Sphingomonas sp. Leaf407]|uniref:patatin-like protein n=1 Tax=unclassified Sphingomonas TaxID=196159 RepID=UPI0006FD38BC|nr:MULTISPECIES: patatin-like protein [unclassified Sphingomonas]KQN40480.1 patatin [Sphingomonas sp. Leaf42]KQT29834.1 patatin [Sphingomonas sp. Leaf407]